jgi:hypothetical protein
MKELDWEHICSLLHVPTAWRWLTETRILLRRLAKVETVCFLNTF